MNMRLLTTAVVAAVIAGGSTAGAQTAPVGEGQAVPPPLSVPKAKYYKAHPAEWKRLLDRLPKVRKVPLAKHAEYPAPAVNTWTPTANPPPASGLSNPLLLPDGSVIVHALCTGSWYKLKPNGLGSYINGTWSTIASLPSGYT